MPKTYLFYDLETTGRNKCFDQVLQFAAIRTDLDLNELERYEIPVKLNCDVIPDPEAILIHNIPIETMLQGSSEIAAMEKIYTLFNTPGTQSGGYNTLGFDDEFLRFSFYRNLLPAYTHQWANECGRFDLYPLATLYYLFKNTALNWPMLDDKPTLKLEYLNSANQLAKGAAHNAMVDVEATLGLARLFARDAEMWHYAMGYYDKKIDSHRVKQLPAWTSGNGQQHYLGLMVGECGAKDLYQFPVLSLGQHNHYKNQSLWLRLDKSELINVTSDTVAQNSWVARKKIAEPGLLLPLSSRFTQHLTAERLKTMQDNLQWLHNNPQALQDIMHYHKEYTYPKIPSIDANAALYDNGFLTQQEEQLCQFFHHAIPEKKIQFAAQFSNPTLSQLMLRILGRHYSELLTPELAQQFKAYLISNYSSNAAARVDYRGEKCLTPHGALEIIHNLYQERELNNCQQKLLSGLEAYIRNLAITMKDAFLSNVVE
ncbi:MAG TPA: exonuclease domain-containing protein [Gammaproteobacteria bacterium]|nr:exonuclease domain-containing protein [Gammaproteobacteria bacterium]